MLNGVNPALYVLVPASFGMVRAAVTWLAASTDLFRFRLGARNAFASCSVQCLFRQNVSDLNALFT